MVEHAVKDHLNPLCVAFLYKICQVGIVTQTAVKFFVIGCFITVSDRFKERSDIDCIAADFLYMIDPGDRLIQPVYRCCISVFLRCIA